MNDDLIHLQDLDTYSHIRPSRIARTFSKWDVCLERTQEKLSFKLSIDAAGTSDKTLICLMNDKPF